MVLLLKRELRGLRPGVKVGVTSSCSWKQNSEERRER